MGINYSPKIVTDGLVLCLDAANPLSYTPGDSVWKDLSGLGNNGTLTNGPTFSNTNGGSIIFDGVNDYVSLTNNDGLGNSFSKFSIDLIIRTRTGTGVSGLGYILLRSTSYIVGSSVYAIYMATDSLNFSVNGGNYLILNNKNNVLGHYCYIWDGSVTKLYTNGVFTASLNFTTFSNQRYNSVTNLGGSSLASTYRPADCDFFSLKIYDKALSANEVSQNYLATKGRFGL